MEKGPPLAGTHAHPAGKLPADAAEQSLGLRPLSGQTGREIGCVRWARRIGAHEFSQERRFARLAAETQAPIMMADKTKLSPTACTAVFQLGHEALPSSHSKPLSSAASAVRLLTRVFRGCQAVRKAYECTGRPISQPGGLFIWRTVFGGLLSYFS